MSCNKDGIVGRIANISQPTIVRGSDGFVVTQIVYQGSGDPYKIDSFAGATAQFRAEEGDAPISIVGALESADRGELRFELAASGTELLAVGDELDFQQVVEDADGVRIIVFEGKLSVRDSLF